MGQCSFGGQPCLDPLLLAQELRSQQAAGARVDLSFIGRANSYRCPLGQEIGRGAILLTRASLASLNIDAAQNLVFSLAASEITGVPSLTAQTVPLLNLLMVRASCVAPGLLGSGDAPYLCELVDQRYAASASVIDKAYNLRATAGASPGCYLSATLNSGAPWTWHDMVADVWSNILGFGAFPGLPLTPDGTPEGFNFYGGNAYEALGKILSRLTFALQFNPLDYSLHIVNIGQLDPDAIAALTALYGQRVWDADFVESVTGRLPTTCRVLFPKQQTTADATGASTYYISDQTDPTVALDTDIGADEEGATLSTAGGGGGTIINETPTAGTFAIVHDDMAATYDASGTLTNSTALNSRAVERAADYFVCAKQARLLRSFIGPRNIPGLSPGSQIQATAWRDYGDGYITDVENQPFAEGWPFKPQKQTADLARRVLSDGTITVQPTGEGEAQTLILGGGAGAGGSYINVTSATPNGAGFYPGTLDTYAAGVWTTGAAVSVKNINALALASGTRVVAFASGLDGTTPAYLTGAGGFTGTRTRVSSATCSGGTLTVVAYTDTYVNGILTASV